MNQIVRSLSESIPLFEGIDPNRLDQLLEDAVWFSLPGGWSLFNAGDEPDALYFVVAGTLIVTRFGTQGDTDIVGYVKAGEPVGEIALLLGTRHSASAYALRDTELIRIEKAVFDRLWTEFPTLARSMSRQMVVRAREEGGQLRASRPKVFTMIGTSPSIEVSFYGRQLQDRLRAMGLRCQMFAGGDEMAISSQFEQAERDNDVILLLTRLENSAWFRLSLRQADRIFVLARSDARPSVPMPLLPSQTENSRRFGLVDLILLELGAHRSTPTMDWANAVGANRIFHWKTPSDADRLSRVICGRSIGLVLSGGGARAYAHIGAIQALREFGYDFDFIGGTSMGAVVGACYAMGWSEQVIDERIRDGFVVSNPLGDFSLPVMALTKGHRVDERLRHHFADTHIEDMPVPFFCVSTALKAGCDFVHRQGRLRDALRASISLPGVLPPVAMGEEVHVDGAVINNLPTDIMSRLHRGRTIAIDVSRRSSFSADDFEERQSFLGWIRTHGIGTAPPIVNLLMRTATLTQDPDKGHAFADLVVTPIIEGVELRDWKAYDPAVAAGYEAMVKALQDSPLS